MGKEPSPTLKQWKDVYRAAVEFRNLRPWSWMRDSEVFGVQNPTNGEIGYCSVIGELGECRGLVVYLGREGLDTYLRMESGRISSESDELLLTQRCLLASFEPKRELATSDLKLIQRIGLKQGRERGLWPMLRSYHPGYYPWYLNKEEVYFLTLALKQAAVVCLNRKQNPFLLVPPQNGYYLVRVFKEEKWRDEWKKPAPQKRKRVVALPIEEERLRGIEQMPRKDWIWEGDFFHFIPIPIQEDKSRRPFFPLLFLWSDQQSRFVFHFDITDPSQGADRLYQGFLSSAEKVRTLPQEIWVQKREAVKILEPLAKRLGIRLKQVRRLRAIEDARESLTEFIISGASAKDRHRKSLWSEVGEILEQKGF
jgi:hypothetical protein